MGVSNNSPTFSYVHFSGVSVVYNNELYMVQDYATNKKYIYYNVDLPNQLNSSNVMPNRSLKQFLVAINDNGMATLVPSTSDDFSISFDGNSTQAIKDRIFGLYEKNEQFGEKFVAIEQDINGIKQIVGEGGVGGEGYDDSAVWEKISQIEQTAEKIDLSVKETTKKYNDDKETNQLRENLNSSIIKMNSNLGTFKSEITTYFKNNEITEEETIQINTQLGILENEKVALDGYVDTVKLVAEKNNQTQDVVAIESAKRALDIAHNNLKNNISNAIIDSIITSTENTIIIDSFAKYNLRLNELKKTCDDIIILGLGGVITEELANISIKADEIRLSVSKVESDFKTDMSVQKIEIESQIKDVSDALGTFENTVNTVFKDGIIDETEKILLQEKKDNIDKEKLDVDAKYNSVVNDENLSEDIKTELITKYEEYNDKHSELKSKIEYVISDSMVNDAEKLEINTLFKEYANVLAYFSALMTKAVEDITFNTAKVELEQAKNDLKVEINDVKDSIAGIGGIIDGTFEDNILDEVERKNIEQNLENLSRERIDIDNTYNSMYASEYLLGQSKEHFKIVYDEYVDAFNEVVSVSTGILNKETLIDNVDRANLDSAILAHKDKLNLLSIETNKVMDIIALNKSNALKGDMQQEISDVNNRIDDILGDISGAVGDGIIDEAEAIIIKNSLDNIKKEKLDVDAKYSVIYENEYLNGEAKTNLIQAKNEFDIVIENLISTITTIIEDNKVTDDESIILEESKQGYMEKSAILNTRFQEAIDYISKTQVDKAKEQFQKEINDLGGVLSELENTMNGAFQDGILTEAEKLSIKQHLLTLSSEKSDVDKQYETIFANEHLEGQPKTDLSTAYNSYVLAYNSLVTVINNILEKEGLIDSTDRNKLNNAFKEHDSKLGLYSTNATNALDAISKKKAEVESEKLDKKFADIIIDLEEGITSKVEHLNKQVNGDGGISERLQIAEEKITEDGITQIVKDIQYIKDFENGIETNRENISKIDQKADKINLSVESKVDGNSIISAINMSPESIKINSSKINITGFVTFSDLRGSGTTTINGSNITTGTINGNLANITNINASNITTGTLSGNRISGGTIQGSLLQTYADDSTKGVRIAKESMQLNNASFFYKTDGNFNIQCKEGVNISSMQDIYIMPGLNASGTVTGNYDVVIPGCTTRLQKLYVVNDATIGGKLSISSTLSANSLSTSGDITSSNGNVSGNVLYASSKNMRLSYDSNTFIPSQGTYGSYNLFLGSRKILAPPNTSLKALFVVNEYGQTGYINAHLATNTYAADIVETKVFNETSILDNTVVAETNKGKCIIPTIQTMSESEIEGEELESILKRNCAVVKDGVVYNDITSMVYILWEEVQKMKSQL